MLVCSVSLRPPRSGIAADIAEAAAALDNLGSDSGQVVFATLVDDPASVGEIVDAYLGEVMLEAASAVDAISVSNVYIAAMVEPVTAADLVDAVKVVNTPSADFLARTSGLDTTHINAYTALIDGLVADAIWPKLDVLRIYATQDSTTALLNLVSSSYTGTVHGSPTFTADRGFTGSEGSSTIWIDSGFNPTTAPSPKFVQNSAHISQWMINNTAGNPALGYANSGSTSNVYLLKYTGDNIVYVRVNSSNVVGSTGTTPFSGHVIGNRYDSGDWAAYRNGSAIVATSAAASVAPANLNFYELALNNNGTANGAGNQFAMFSWGSSLTATDALNFYNRLRTYMTAVGVP